MKQKGTLTKREKDVYDFVVSFRNEKHFSPSMRRIAQGIGVYSVSTVAVHVHNIVDKGWFMPYDSTPNSIVPVTELEI